MATRLIFSQGLRPGAFAFWHQTMGFFFALTLLLSAAGIGAYFYTVGWLHYLCWLPLCGLWPFWSSFWILRQMHHYLEALAKGDLAEAERCLRRAHLGRFLITAHRRRIAQLLADVLFQEGEYREALALIEKTLTRPARHGELSDSVLRLDQALYLMAQARFEAARKILDTVDTSTLMPALEAKKMYLELRWKIQAGPKEDLIEEATRLKKQFQNYPGFFAALGYALAETLLCPERDELIQEKVQQAAGELAVQRYLDEARTQPAATPLTQEGFSPMLPEPKKRPVSQLALALVSILILYTIGSNLMSIWARIQDTTHRELPDIQRFATVREFLRPGPPIHYVTDGQTGPGSWEQVKAQYALAPRLLDIGETAEPLILGNFNDPATISKIQQEKSLPPTCLNSSQAHHTISLLKDFGEGVFLFRDETLPLMETLSEDIPAPQERPLVKFFCHLSILTPFLIGLLLVQKLCPARTTNGFTRLLQWSLAPALGLGVCSILLFAWLLFMGAATPLYLVAEGGLLVLLTALFRPWKEQNYSVTTLPVPATETATFSSGQKWLLRTGVLLAVLLAIAAFALTAERHPFGIWDVVSHWNVLGRFIAEGGERWLDFFSDIRSTGGGRDYPMLLPLVVARGWMSSEPNTSLVPTLVDAIFTFGLLGVVTAAVGLLRGTMAALLAGLMLLCTRNLFAQTTLFQMADVPMTFYFTAALALLALANRQPPGEKKHFFLIGLLLGLSLWTKNEGIPLLLILVGIQALFILFRPDKRAAIARLFILGLGLFPGLVAVYIFKHDIGSFSTMLLGSGNGTLQERLLNPDRTLIILQAFVQECGNAKRWTVWPWLLILPLFSEYRAGTIRTERWWAILILTGLLGMVFLVFQITPMELRWHLETYLDRAVAPLFSSAIFLIFLIVKTPETQEKG